jgi:hypothetical protein
MAADGHIANVQSPQRELPLFPSPNKIVSLPVAVEPVDEGMDIGLPMARVMPGDHAPRPHAATHHDKRVESKTIILTGECRCVRLTRKDTKALNPLTARIRCCPICAMMAAQYSFALVRRRTQKAPTPYWEQSLYFYIIMLCVALGKFPPSLATLYVDTTQICSSSVSRGMLVLLQL